MDKKSLYFYLKSLFLSFLALSASLLFFSATFLPLSNCPSFLSFPPSLPPRFLPPVDRGSSRSISEAS